jgi:CHRD domain
MLKTIGAVTLAALALAGLALAASSGSKYGLTANLKARSEVPAPKGVPVGATGLFTAKAVEGANDKTTISWRLTFSHLSGPAAAAHIHLAKVGVAGPVVAALCGPCKSGQKGTAVVTQAQWNKIEKGGGYVNVHTAKNPGGEIRGQVKVSG